MKREIEGRFNFDKSTENKSEQYDEEGGIRIDKENGDSLCEVRERREDALMSKRHEVAIMLNDIDLHVLNNPDEDITITKDLPEESLNKIKEDKNTRRFILSFYNKCIEAEEKFETLNDKYKDDDSSEKLNASELGKKIFEDFTGSMPKGEILFQRRSFFLLLTCEDKRDHNFFKNTTSGKKSLGEKECDIGGTFYSNHRIANFLLEIDGSRGKMSKDSSFLHERQHAINALTVGMEQFALVENPVPDKMWDKKFIRIALHGIKNELLARIRGGDMEPEKIAEFLKYDYGLSWKNELYIRDRKNYTWKPRELSPPMEEIYLLIDQVANGLDDLQDIFSDTELSGVLVYSLLDVPFEKMPKYLSSLTRYFKKRILSLEELREKEEETDFSLKAKKTDIFPSDYKNELEELFVKKEKAKRSYLKARGSALTTKEKSKNIVDLGILAIDNFEKAKQKILPLIESCTYCSSLWPRDEGKLGIAQKAVDYINSRVKMEMIRDEFEDFKSGANEISSEFKEIISYEFDKQNTNIKRAEIISDSSSNKSFVLALLLEDEDGDKFNMRIVFPLL